LLIERISPHQNLITMRDEEEVTKGFTGVSRGEIQRDCSGADSPQRRFWLCADWWVLLRQGQSPAAAASCYKRLERIGGPAIVPGRTSDEPESDQSNAAA
jgi:hypothetical protein